MVGAPASDSLLSKMLHKFANWITVRDYENAKDQATDRIVKRQARGSIFAQNGWYMSVDELKRNSYEADDDVEYVRRALK